MALKDAVGFTIVHSSFYDIVFLGGGVPYINRDIGLEQTVEQHSQSAGEYLLVSILQDGGLGVDL